MRQPDDAALVLDIVLAAGDAARLLEGETYDMYLDDLRLQLALVKLIEIIGEASGKLSQEARSSMMNIPWIDIIASVIALCMTIARLTCSSSGKPPTRTCRCSPRS